jgi:tetratricopeptide (TPR) repeat protein
VVQELLFPEATDAQGSHNLRQLLYRLRQIGAPIESDADQLSVPLDRLFVDWWEFLNRENADRSELECLSVGLFPGYNPRVSASYQEWFDAERAEISLRLSRSLTLRLAHLRDVGRWDLVDIASRALLTLDPLNEEGTLARAEALAASGSKNAAIRVIDDYLTEIGEGEPRLRVAPTALRRRISERLPEVSERLPDDRIFVGREDSMRLLSAMGGSARAGRQQVLHVWGEPGIGKSRLLAEYRALSSLQGGISHLLACQPHDVHRPLGILCDLVEQLLDTPGALGCDPAARQMLARLVTVKADLGSSLEEVAAELPLSAIVRSLSDLISAIAAECPLLLLIDDAQWLDKGSLTAVLGSYASRIQRRSCLIVSSRDRALLAGTESISEGLSSIRLNPLDHGPALELCRGLLRSRTSPEAERIERRILEQARGNPFFIRLLSSHFLSTNDSASLDQTVAEILGRRLEQLSVDARRVLEACVVLAKNCTITRLQTLLQVPRHQLLRAIEELDDCALVQISNGCFISSHALLGDAVVTRMSSSVRSTLHASAAAILERDSAPPHAGSLQWDCAEHWRLAGNDARAVSVLRHCARRAFEIGRTRDAVAILKRALELQTTDELRLSVVEDILFMLEFGINWNEAASLLAELKALRARLGRSQAAHDRFEIQEYASAFHSDSDPTVNITALRRCVSALDAEARHRWSAARQLVMISELTFDSSLADFAFQSTRDLTQGTQTQIFCDMLYHTCFGDPALASELAKQLVRRSVTVPSLLPYTLNAGYAQSRIGSPRDAETTLLRSLEIARQSGMIHGEVHACLLLARLYWCRAMYDESRIWYDRFANYSTLDVQPDLLWEHNILGARLSLREGHVAAAESHIEHARQTARAKLDLPKTLIQSCEIEIRQAKNKVLCTGEELREFIRLHKRSRSLGCHDEVMFAAFIALKAGDLGSDAARLLESYVTSHRRDGFPLDSRLASLLAEDVGAVQLLDELR